MQELFCEMKQSIAQNEPWRLGNHFRSGDAIAVRRVFYQTQEKENVVKGICVGTKRNKYQRGFWLQNIIDGTEVVHFFKLYSPLVRGVDVISKQLVKARRNKLTYLRGNLRSWVKVKTLKNL